MPISPTLPPYHKHVFVCTGKSCHVDAGGEPYTYLKESLKKLAIDHPEIKILRSQSHCLGVCQGGPILLVYPEGVWYSDVTKEKLDVILKEHLIGGHAVSEWAFHQKEEV